MALPGGGPVELFTNRFDSRIRVRWGWKKPIAGISPAASSRLTGRSASLLSSKSGTLGRVPSPRCSPAVSGMSTGRTDSDGSDLAVIRFCGAGSDSNFSGSHPISRRWVSHVRFSPQGDLIAFDDHVATGDDAESSSLTAKATTRSPPVFHDPRKVLPGHATERGLVHSFS